MTLRGAIVGIVMIGLVGIGGSYGLQLLADSLLEGPAFDPTSPAVLRLATTTMALTYVGFIVVAIFNIYPLLALIITALLAIFGQNVLFWAFADTSINNEAYQVTYLMLVGVWCWVMEKTANYRAEKLSHR